MSAAGVASERVLFEARIRSRRLLGCVFAAAALAILWLSVDGHNAFAAIGATGPALLAVREWTSFQLRVTDAWIEHLPPHWAPSGAPAVPNALRLTARIKASEVASLEWDGHDGVGIRMRDGRVEVVAIRDRIAETDQRTAREAVLRFVARAAGQSAVSAAVALDVAPWVVRQSSH